MMNKLRSFLFSGHASIRLGEKLRSALASFFAILCIGLISDMVVSGSALPILVASMGASAVLLFAATSSPMAQPGPLVFGHALSATIGVICAQWIPDVVLAAAVAVAVAILVMYLLNSLHPPGGAAALIPVLGDEQIHGMGFQFVAVPVLLNVVVMLLLAIVINRWVLRRDYPHRPYQASDQAHQHADPRPLDRLGMNMTDLRAALGEMNVYLDITEADLIKVYRGAEAQSYRRRLGEISCADIMSRDVATVDYDTELEDVWALLRHHKVAMLPVVDRHRRVMGTVSLVDILKRADLKSYATFEDKLRKFIRRTPGLTAEKPEVAGHIMATPVVTVAQDMHIIDLVPLLSDRGLHHLPVINEKRQLVGMVTQSDLIASLYAGSRE